MSRTSKYDDKRYGYGRSPTRRLAEHNGITWLKLLRHLVDNGNALHYRTLVELARDHTSGTKGDPKPASFIRYCIRLGLLTEVK